MPTNSTAPVEPVDDDRVAGAQPSTAVTRVDDARDAQLACRDRTMAQRTADVDDERPRHHEERHPARVGGFADEDLAVFEQCVGQRVGHHPHPAGDDARRDADALNLARLRLESVLRVLGLRRRHSAPGVGQPQAPARVVEDPALGDHLAHIRRQLSHQLGRGQEEDVVARRQLPLAGERAPGGAGTGTCDIQQLHVGGLADLALQDELRGELQHQSGGRPLVPRQRGQELALDVSAPCDLAGLPLQRAVAGAHGRIRVQ